MRYFPPIVALVMLGLTSLAVSAGYAQEVAAPAGDAAPQIASSSMWSVMVDGGPLMWPIAACSILLAIFVFGRLYSLRRVRVASPMFIQKFLEQIKGGQLGRDAAYELCQKNGSAVAEVFAAAVKKWGRPAVEVEQAVIDAGERVTHDLRKYLRLFNGISSVTPLLGLLGTVLGMIESFNAIVTAEAMGRAELLAGGIGQALLTTAGGLFVAIPALIAYMFFQSRAEVLILAIDAAAQQVVEIVSAEGIERDSATKTVVSKKSKAA